jgi:hypothetical protein
MVSWGLLASKGPQTAKALSPAAQQAQDAWLVCYSTGAAASLGLVTGNAAHCGSSLLVEHSCAGKTLHLSGCCSSMLLHLRSLYDEAAPSMPLQGWL